MSSKNTLPWPESARFSRHPALYVEARTCAGRGLWTVGIRLRHNGGRLAKRRQALLESNPPRNSQRETHRKAVGRSGLGLAFAHGSSAFDRFPHASKTRIVPPKTGSGRVRPDCRRFHGSYLSFDSDALQAGTGWHSTSRVGGGALPRWPPSAAQTVRADFRHTAFTRTPASGRENRAKVSER